MLLIRDNWAGCAIARGKNLANASGLTALGLVGVLMPLWLIALIMAVVGAAPSQPPSSPGA